MPTEDIKRQALENTKLTCFSFKCHELINKGKLIISKYEAKQSIEEEIHFCQALKTSDGITENVLKFFEIK